jgi:PIN domain nuclease of toxin-antitoxin system
MADLIYLDTHVVVWLYAGELELFGNRARRDLEECDLLISPMVTLEIQYLHQTGRLTVEADPMIDDLRRTLDLRISDIPFHQVISRSLGNIWTRDPFDRLIAAQAALGQHRLLTKDQNIRDHYTRAYWN